MIEEGRVDHIGDELPPPPPPPEAAAEAARREAEEEARVRAPFVIGIVTVPRIIRRVPVREGFAHSGEEVDMEGELGIDFNNVLNA